MLRTTFQSLCYTARATHLAAQQSRQDLAEALTEVFRQLLPAGTLIDLRRGREAPPPDYLFNVRTLAGNDRGTRLFRIVQVTGVEANARTPELSTWVADAVPVSEKTGRDMRASSGHASGRAMVRLHGSVTVSHSPEEPAAAQLERLLALVEQVQAGQGDATQAGA